MQLKARRPQLEVCRAESLGRGSKASGTWQREYQLIKRSTTSTSVLHHLPEEC